MTLTANAVSLGGRLADVSCTLEPGKITAICGPNGAGKSTLLDILAGLSIPDTGEAELDGRPLHSMSPRERGQRIGYLPQTQEIAWDVSVRKLIELGRMPYRDQLEGPVDAAIDALDLRAFEHRRAQSLSGGETARVLLARVLAGQPGWILADEPLAALDLGHQAALLRHLRLVADQGVGVAIVLHDLAHAMNHADRVIVLDHGSIAADGRPETALSAETIADVWRIATIWVDAYGRQALVPLKGALPGEAR